MELAGRAVSKARSAGRDQIHFYSHQPVSVEVFDYGPGHLNDVALCFVISHASGSRVPAIVRWMAARPTQSSKPGPEPVTDADVYEGGMPLAAEPVDALFPRDHAGLDGGI